MLELGGKNALIAFPDADLEAVSAAVVDGMNFTWCGQSCGSTSRAFVHEKIYDAVLERVKNSIKRYKPGIPTDPATTMGSIISQVQYDRVHGLHRGRQAGRRAAASAAASGRAIRISPRASSSSRRYLPTSPWTCASARRRSSGPILSIFKWSDEDKMLAQVNQVEYGLTCSIWTNDLVTAHRTAAAVEAGFVWINEVSKHFLGAPFGGYKQSGVGREEGIEELHAASRARRTSTSI